MNIAIVGAGIIGRLLALQLAHAGKQVSIFDQDNRQGLASCSIGAAGILTPCTDLEKADLIFELGCESVHEHWGKIIAMLKTPVFYRQEGLIVITHPSDKAQMSRLMNIIGDKFKGKNVYRILDQKELHTLEPELTKFNEGYYFTNEGQLDNQSLIPVLADTLEDMGVTWHDNTTVTQVEPGKVHVNGTTHTFDVVFDCRGMGGKALYPQLRGIRGEVVWLHAPEVKISRPVRLMHPRYGIYIVPRPNDIYVIGATEIESEDGGPISVRGALELLTAVYSLHTGFSEARIIKTTTCVRPALPNHMPTIKYTDGLIAVNGLYRNGFTVSPAVVAEIMRFLEQGAAARRHPQMWETLA